LKEEQMVSWQAYTTSFVLRHTFKPRLAAATSVAEIRALMNTGTGFKFPPGIRITEAVVGGVPGEWVEPRTAASDRLLLYVHGGGGVACSARTHRSFSSAFAQRGFRVFVPNYRLAPEHPFPAGLTDVIAAYRALRATRRHGSRVVIAGDSAGGGLALATMLALRDDNEPLPVGAALFSPFTNLAETGGSRKINEERCAFFRRTSLLRFKDLYLANSDPRLPLASPLLADLRGLPPLFIHVSADETLLDDASRLAHRARDTEVAVEFDAWPGVPHVFPLFHHLIPEGRQSLASAGRFLRAAAAGRAR
jgi:monoterpene epsilon-lactone hydrolase